MRFSFATCVLLLCSSALGSSCTTEQSNSPNYPEYPKDNKLPADAASALSHPDTAVLYSLEPWAPPSAKENAPLFDEWYILGKVTLSGDQVAVATNTFKAAITPARNQWQASCFDPRHGLRLTSLGHSYDFILCYQCAQLGVMRDGKPLVSLDAFGKPDTLNALLAAAHIPVSQTGQQ
jgi:hypothetical protein